MSTLPELGGRETLRVLLGNASGVTQLGLGATTTKLKMGQPFLTAGPTIRETRAPTRMNEVRPMLLDAGTLTLLDTGGGPVLLDAIEEILMLARIQTGALMITSRTRAEGSLDNG